MRHALNVTAWCSLVVVMGYTLTTLAAAAGRVDLIVLVPVVMIAAPFVIVVRRK